MYNAKLHYENLSDDKEMQVTAWFTSLLMSATGNYGKKGIEPKKLYVSQYDENGNYVQKTDGPFTPIDKDVKDKQLNSLIDKFNKANEKVTKVE